MLEILLKPQAKKTRLGPHNTVVRGAIGRRTGKNMDPDLLFIDLSGFSLDGVQAYELKEPHEPSRLGEGAGGQDSLEEFHPLVDLLRRFFSSGGEALIQPGIHLNHT